MTRMLLTVMLLIDTVFKPKYCCCLDDDDTGDVGNNKL
jgi:hypothetical protein